MIESGFPTPTGFWAANRQRPRGRYAYALTKPVRAALERSVWPEGRPPLFDGAPESVSPVIHGLASHDVFAAFLRASDAERGVGLAAWVSDRGPILTGKVESYQGIYDFLPARAPLHVGFVVDSARRAASVRARLRGTEQDGSVVTTHVVTEPALAADPYGALWATPQGVEARAVDFAPHWTGNPWPYLRPGELADPTTLEALDDRVYRRIPMLASAL